MYQVSLPDSTQLLLQAKENQAIPPIHGLRQEVYPSLFLHAKIAVPYYQHHTSKATDYTNMA